MRPGPLDPQNYQQTKGARCYFISLSFEVAHSVSYFPHCSDKIPWEKQLKDQTGLFRLTTVPGGDVRPRRQRDKSLRPVHAPGSQPREWCHPLWANPPTSLSLVQIMPHRHVHPPVWISPIWHACYTAIVTRTTCLLYTIVTDRDPKVMWKSARIVVSILKTKVKWKLPCSYSCMVLSCIRIKEANKLICIKIVIGNAFMCM